jgi:uncharacterized membrane protein YeaQ/YmgE (transglycosylase-associated protein family)
MPPGGRNFLAKKANWHAKCLMLFRWKFSNNPPTEGDKEKTMIGWIIVILAGAFFGWIASMIMGTDAQMGALANIVVGLIGAVIGRFIAGLVGLAPQGTDFSVGGILFGVLGACVLLAIVKALTRGGGRRLTA